MNIHLKRFIIGFGVMIVGIILLALTYVIYMQSQYYRIEDNKDLKIINQSSEVVQLDKEYSALTYNIGFGAYDHDFSFFMDSGTMKDGKKVTGTMSRGQSKEIVENNTQGALDITTKENTDFVLLQEVDVKATRSFNINQKSEFEKGLNGYTSDFAYNFHSSYLIYPFSEPHGSVEAGLSSFSKYKIEKATRRSYPVNESFFPKFFDLDRCFVVNRINVENGKELVLINSHMSAYDKGGKIREKQLELLNSVMKEEYKKGNYIIVGGDFNHALCGSKDIYKSKQEVPNWVFELDNEDLCDGLSIVRANNIKEVPTIRSTDIPYEKGVNYTATLDGYIVSDNIEAIASNIDTDFMYSDHNPVRLSFILK